MPIVACERKISRGSFVSVSSAFVDKVDHMVKTILVPTKLMDIDCKEDASIPPIVQSGTSNLFEVYSVIKQFKEKLASLALDEEQLSNLSPFEVDETLFTPTGLNSLDSGHWSSCSGGSSASVHSEDQDSSDRSYSSDNELSTSEVSFRVRRSLHSAKGLVAFLADMTLLVDYVVIRYCEEFQCD